MDANWLDDMAGQLKFTAGLTDEQRDACFSRYVKICDQVIELKRKEVALEREEVALNEALRRHRDAAAVPKRMERPDADSDAGGVVHIVID